jgi:hypothetical protein
MLRWRNFTPSLSVVCNPPVRWLPYVFNNAQCTVWVSDGTSLLQLYRQTTGDRVYAVLLKPRPNGQLQLGPRFFVSAALSQDAAMEMIAINIFGPSPFRWSQFSDWKQQLRSVFAYNGFAMEDVHHFGAEFFLLRRMYLNPHPFWDMIPVIRPSALAIVLPGQRRVCLHRVVCSPVPLIWHIPTKPTAVWIASLRDQLKTQTVMKFFRGEPGNIYVPIILDDVDLPAEFSSRIKSALAVGDRKALSYQRWSAARFDQGQPRIVNANQYDATAEVPLGRASSFFPVRKIGK